MSEKIKKIICCITACCVLIFSCVFCPRQRAEAFAFAPVVCTVAGLFALGLLAYGVSTTADSDFVQDNLGSFSDAVGFLSDPFSEVRTKVCASLVLSAALPFAEQAYSSGSCSSIIQGPSLPPELPEAYYSFCSTSNGSLKISSGATFYYPSNYPFFHVCSSRPCYIAKVGKDYRIFYFNGSIQQYQRVISNGDRYYPFLSRYSDYSSYIEKYYFFNYSQMSSLMSYFGSNNPNFSDSESFYNWGCSIFSDLGITHTFNSDEEVISFLSSNPTWSSPGSISADVSAKPVIPGACDVFNSSKSLDSYHVDSPGNDVLDLGNVLEKTGCESIDDVVSKVYTGDLSASDVIGGLDCRPYVDVDADTGTIAIPNETINSRPIALDKDLSIPSDIADTDTYEPINPPKDDTTTDKPSLPKGAYAFPLADYFPFCLPFDLYKFCFLFVATPKTPEITLDFSTFLPFLDKDNPEQYVYTFDLHSLDKLAEIVRTLELFGIVLGIGLITRRIIGW